MNILNKLKLGPRNLLEKALVYFLKEDDGDTKIIMTTEDSSRILLELIRTESGVIKTTVGDDNKEDVSSSDHTHSVADVTGLVEALSNNTALIEALADIEILNTTVAELQAEILALTTTVNEDRVW